MSQVIINDIPPRTQAIATGGQTVFGTNWTANYPSDVVVYQRASGTAANDFTQILSYPSEYSVSFVGDQQQVQVTLVTPSTNGDIVTIIRLTPSDRENLYTNTNFLPSMLNNDFGILTLVEQQAQLVNQLIGPRYNYSAIIIPVVDTILPILPANCGWVKNADDDEIIPYLFPESGIAPADATYVTLTDDTGDLPNSFPLSNLGAGILINKVSTNEILTRIVAGTNGQITVVNGDGLTGNIIISITPNPVIPGTAGMGIPQGTTAQRVAPVTGIGLRFNTTIGSLEYWDGAQWVQLEDSTDIATILALLASHAPGEGASLIGLQGSGTVQDLAELDFITNTDQSAVAPNSLILGDLALLLAGGTMAGDIDMNGKFIHNLIDPVSAQDAATKAYVDGEIATLPLAHNFIYVGNLSNVATGVAMSGDATIADTGAVTVSKIGGVGIALGGAFTTIGAFTVGFTFTGNTAVTFPTSGTLATTANLGAYLPLAGGTMTGDITFATGHSIKTNTSAGNTLLLQAYDVDGAAYVTFATLTANNTPTFDLSASTTVGGNPIAVSPLTTKGDLWGFSTINARLPVASGDGKILQVASGAVTGLAYSTPTYPSASGAIGVLLRSDSVNNVYTTSTFADTYAASVLLYSNGANTVTGLATGNDGVLITSHTGVPSWLANPAATGRYLSSVNGAPAVWSGFVPAASGANADITSMTGLTGTLQAPTGIASSTGLLNLAFNYTASAVNHFLMSNNITSNAPSLVVDGTDAAISMTLGVKNGVFRLIDTTNTTAPALRFYEATPTDYIGLKAPDSLSASLTYILPATDATTANQPLVSGANTTLSFFRAPTASAWASGSTTLAAGGFTKVLFATELWDTGGYYASSRFTPLVAGFYLTNAAVNTTTSALTTNYATNIYLNGANYKSGDVNSTTLTGGISTSVSGVVPCNGSTDYIEIYSFNGGVGTVATSTLQAFTWCDFTWMAPL